MNYFKEKLELYYNTFKISSHRITNKRVKLWTSIVVLLITQKYFTFVVKSLLITTV